jgi:hypothetical protein
MFEYTSNDPNSAGTLIFQQNLNHRKKENIKNLRKNPEQQQLLHFFINSKGRLE